MRYLALYQTRFVGLPRPVTAGSHVFVTDIDAPDLEVAFFRLQGEFMAEEVAERVGNHPQVQHTSLSVGDILVDDTEAAFMVDVIGFRPVPPDQLPHLKLAA